VVVFFVQLHFTTRVRYGFLSVQLNYTIRQQEIILNLSRIHMPKETIAQVTKSSVDYVEEVIRNADQTIS